MDNELYRSYKSPYKSVLFILSGGVSDFRLGLPARHFADDSTYEVKVTMEVHQYLSMHFDVIVCSRPNPDVCRMLDMFIDAGVKVIIDMDDDFYSIPKDNPCYESMGPGHIGYHDILKKTIEHAALLTVAMPELKKRYGRDDAVVIKNCWDEDNKLWSSRPPHDYIGIGWAGTNTHHADFDLVQNLLVEAVQKYPQTKLVIGADPTMYDRFKDLDETRKLFIPGMPFSYFPAFYHYIDIGIAPLQDNVFNRAKSDIKLVEFGAAGIPYVASNVLPYESWKDGGRLVSNEGEWRSALDGYITMTADSRKLIGAAGHKVAMGRTAKDMTRQWQEVIDKL
jgi:hypothetical protein